MCLITWCHLTRLCIELCERGDHGAWQKEQEWPLIANIASSKGRDPNCLCLKYNPVAQSIWLSKWQLSQLILIKIIDWLWILRFKQLRSEFQIASLFPHAAFPFLKFWTILRGRFRGRTENITSSVDKMIWLIIATTRVHETTRSSSIPIDQWTWNISMNEEPVVRKWTTKC
jgi:hypothetical protein